MASTFPTQNPSPIPAVAIVVDSSLTLASEWPRMLRDYCTHLFKRLAEGNPSFQVGFNVLFSFKFIHKSLHLLATPPRIRHLRTSRLRWIPTPR
jgi:hypothetical protein